MPEERLGHGAAPRMRLSENLLLSRHATDSPAFARLRRMVKNAAVQSAAQRVIQAMDVRKSAPDPEAAALSGGNLQKFIIGRELDRQPTLMVVNQPTWGVDAGAAARIRQALIELARAGSAVLVISQDLDELFEISDSIAVMHNGELSKPLSRTEATYEQHRPIDGRRGTRPPDRIMWRWCDGPHAALATSASDAGGSPMRLELVKRPERSRAFRGAVAL